MITQYRSVYNNFYVVGTSMTVYMASIGEGTYR